MFFSLLTLSCDVVVVVVVNVFGVPWDQCYRCTVWDLISNSSTLALHYYQPPILRK